MSNWHLTSYSCPVCGVTVWARLDRLEGTVCELEYECRFCHEWSEEFSYGYKSERVGFEVFEWTDLAGSPHAEIVEACAEMIRVCRHPDYETMKREAPRGVLADWFGDHEFPIQEAALRAQLASVES